MISYGPNTSALITTARPLPLAISHVGHGLEARSASVVTMMVETSHNKPSTQTESDEATQTIQH